jgi:signal transduction histidine kinase
MFWSLMAAGAGLWWMNVAGWTWYEVILRREVPDPFAGDVVLFAHVVPFMAAVGLRPDRHREGQKLPLGTLNFLILLIWWMFLYAFLVFPEQYVHTVLKVYSRNYDALYRVENVVLVAGLAATAWHASGAWAAIYRRLFVAAGFYALSSGLIGVASALGRYYSGSLYDVPYVASICWLVLAGLMAGGIEPSGEPAPRWETGWVTLAPRLVMIALLSLPFLAAWAFFFDSSPPQIRHFRLLATLSTAFILGMLLFLKQQGLDRQLLRLLERSRRDLERMGRLQAEIVQREKLALLGQLVAGAANEIHNPVAAILECAERIAKDPSLNEKQTRMAQKIGLQARRTQDLLVGLLSFAQRDPREKLMVDLGVVLQRAVQAQTPQLVSRNIRVETKIVPGLPRVWGNSDQILRCCLEIIGNAKDALEEVGGGSFCVSARGEGDAVVLEFSDSGPGMREPHRVFDPFYTTKPVGKGAGLGLSATYGMVQDHRGQISCYNRPEGGAAFVIRLPAMAEIEAVEAS